ncbi:MAG: hypothetical protein ABR985_17265 [Methanotrichaceae archaeon]|jgi:CRISPR/Cas system-associated protein Cas10 (large subunit of type III CRISPR-Cas system)
MSDKTLLSGDVDAIKEFVFETSFLPQIRGGSQLLIDCENAVKEYVQDAKGGEIIYCNGGSFLISMPSGEIARAKHDIEQIYLKNTYLATVTIASEQESLLPGKISPWDPETSGRLGPWASRIWMAGTHQKYQENSFGLKSSFLSMKVREHKQQKRIAPFVEALPFGDRCDCCGKRMASEKIPLKKQGETEVKDILKVCGVCHHKHERGRSGDYRTRGKFNEDFHNFVKDKIPIRSVQPSDLDDLVQSASRDYLAFIYADGNNIGDLLSQANSEEDYKAISGGLFEGTRDSLFGALSNVCGPALMKDGSWPFEIINVGGDDVTLLIQAGYAWEVAIQFLENFGKTIPACIEKKLGHFSSDWQITASCGISVANKSFPIRFLQRLAEGSLKRAKKKAKENGKVLNSAIDFLWLPNPVISENIESLSGYYHRNDRLLTARPYTLDEAKCLQDLASNARDQIPSTQRHLWGEAVDRGINSSRNAIFYNIARMSDENKRKAMEEFLAKITALIAPGSLQNSNSLWAFREYGGKSYYCTALLDVLELAELFSMCEDHGKEESVS